MPRLEFLAPLDRLTVRTEGPAVYGWCFRPVNCGVFHYWNGGRMRGCSCRSAAAVRLGDSCASNT